MKTVSLKTGLFGLIIGCLLSFTVLYQLKATAEPNLIVISKDNVSKGTNLTIWENDNSKYYHDDNTEAGYNCKDNVVVDLNGISTSDGTLVRDWLAKNSDYICYEDSYQFIEQAHIITDSTFITNINNALNPQVLTYEDIKNTTNSFIKIAHPNKPELNFDNHGYQAYLDFHKLFSTNPEFKYETGLAKEGHYSIPFFKSLKYQIEKQFSTTINEKDILCSFVKVKSPDKIEVIAFTVEATVGTTTFKQYYNFSTDPGKPVSYKFL